MRPRLRIFVPAVAVLAAVAGCSVSSRTPKETAGNGGGQAAAAPQGVTATTVKLGVAGTDPAALKAVGIPADGPATKDLYTAWIAAQNKRSGTNGRQIELAFQPFLPDPAAASRVTSRSAKDQGVFAAIGIFTGDTPLCFTQTEGVPYIGLWGDPPTVTRKSTKAPFLAVEMADDRQRRPASRRCWTRGCSPDTRSRCTGRRRTTRSPRTSSSRCVEGGGVDVVVETPLPNSAPTKPRRTRRWTPSSRNSSRPAPTRVLNTSNFAGLMNALQRKSWLPRQILATSQQALSPAVMQTTGIKPATMAPLRRRVAPYAPTKAELTADPGLVQCVTEYSERLPRRVQSGPAGGIAARRPSRASRTGRAFRSVRPGHRQGREGHHPRRAGRCRGGRRRVTLLGRPDGPALGPGAATSARRRRRAPGEPGPGGSRAEWCSARPGQVAAAAAGRVPGTGGEADQRATA
ncbi:ABC transporter substrate-binding protein [Yinghuangia aomiensis]